MGERSADDSGTEERLDRLESAVKQQNETIREMLPGRRAVLAGGAAAALGFAGGAGSASGQSAAGQIGTESAPVDVEAASVHAREVGIDTQDTGSNTTLTTSRSGSPRSLTVQPFSIELFPASGDDRSHFLACNAPDFNNFGFIKWEVDGQDGLVSAGAKGTGTAPTSLIYNNTFPDGITFQPPFTVDTNEQGTRDSPHLFAGFSLNNGPTATAIETASSTISGDNTAQTIVSPGDPPLMGLLVIAGSESGTASSNTFFDLVIHIRNNTVSPVQKTDGNTSMTSRTYSINGADPALSIDHAGVDYDLSLWYIGGKS